LALSFVGAFIPNQRLTSTTGERHLCGVLAKAGSIIEAGSRAAASTSACVACWSTIAGSEPIIQGHTQSCTLSARTSTLMTSTRRCETGRARSPMSTRRPLLSG
jgi:hypothetical protein